MIKVITLLLSFVFAGLPVFAQQQKVELRLFPEENKVDITIGGKPFTAYWYPDTLEKPILYPVYSPKGDMITRGFPIHPNVGEPTDHPHQVGIWFTYENVNGLDFWNNSYAIPEERKSRYGWIRHKEILETKDGNTGILKIAAEWTDQAGNVLLHEETTFEFGGSNHRSTIQRHTRLTAVQPVTFHDVKDGLIGIRVAKELQAPAATYLSSNGDKGDNVWGTRARWCMLYGSLDKHETSITIFDHKENPGYPTWWHARGYGLFAANPLGEKVFTNGKDSLELHLKKGQSADFRYLIAIDQGKIPSVEELNKEADFFDER